MDIQGYIACCCVHGANGNNKSDEANAEWDHDVVEPLSCFV